MARKRPPSVQLNLNVRGLAHSATVALNERCDEIKRLGRGVFKMGLGQSPFPVPETVVQALRDHAHEKDYLPVQGLFELRQAVCDHHKREFGIDREPDDVLIGPGSKELMFLLQLVYYGELVIPTPAWVSYAPQAHLLGRKVQLLPTSAQFNWKLTPRDLDRLCKTDRGRPRIVVLNYPSNPTGCTYNPEELQELAQIARRHRVILLSDEIYGLLHHEGEHRSIAPMYPEGTIFSGGLSKWCGAGGWRLGVFVFPRALRWLLKAMAAVASETYTATSAPIQFAGIRAFEGGGAIDDYLDCSRRILKSLGLELARRLRSAGVKVIEPEGGFYLFPDFAPLAERLRARKIHTAYELCERLLHDTGVAILPGRVFGRPDEELTARIAYVNFNGKKALQALGATKVPPGLEFIEHWCAASLEAIDRLCDWVTAS